MRIPKVPSLLHFARFASKEVKVADRRLREMAERPPHINYVPAKRGARDHLILGVNPEAILASVERIKADQQRMANKAALEAFFEFSPQIADRRFADVDPRYFPIGRKLHVPVNPFLYSTGGGVESLLWPSFWSNLSLKEDQLAVYGTVLDMVFLSSYDYASCELELADLGKIPGEKIRSVRLFKRSDIPTLTTAELKQYTDPFAEAFIKLVEDIRGSGAGKRTPERAEAPADWYLDQQPPRP